MHVDVRRLQHHPPSITEDYMNYNKGSVFLAIVATLVSIALSIFFLRVYIRIRLLRFFGIDDWFITIAALCALAMLVVMASLTQLGLGKHLLAIPSKDVLEIEPWILSFTLLGVVGLGCVKLSVAFFLLRIVHRTCYRRFLYGMIGLIIPWTFVWFSTLLFQCVPIAAAWDPSLQSRARCMLQSASKSISLAHNLINIILNLALIILSSLIIWGLRISLEIRISFIATISLGVLAFAAAIVRTPLIYSFDKEQDPYAHGAWILIWSIIELTIAMTAATLPTLKPTLLSLLTFLKSFTRRSRPKISTAKISSPTSPIHQSFHSLPPLSFSHPRSAYFPTRFHDHTSDLDFDIETPPSRTRTHSRSPSGVTTFSAFTNLSYYMTPGDYDEGAATVVNGRPRATSKVVNDGVEEDAVRLRASSLIGAEAGIEDGVGSGSRKGCSVSVTSGETTWDAVVDGAEARSVRRVDSEGKAKEEDGGITKKTEVTVR